MAYIPLEQGGFVQVDPEDEGWLGKMGPWRRSREGYIYRGSRDTRDIQKMHTAIAEHYNWNRAGKYVDHIYQNKEDMRKSYLRLLSPAESNKNRRVKTPGL